LHACLICLICLIWLVCQICLICLIRQICLIRLICLRFIVPAPASVKLLPVLLPDPCVESLSPAAGQSLRPRPCLGDVGRSWVSGSSASSLCSTDVAIGTTPIERKFMVFDGEALRCQVSELPGAGVDIEDTLAPAALEMVMVAMAACLIARIFARKENRLQFLLLHHRLEVAVHGAKTQRGHHFLRLIQDFQRQERPL